MDIRKKVLFCNSNSIYPFSLSGAEITMHDFLDILAEAGYEVLSVNCCERYNLYCKYYEKVNDNGQFDVYIKFKHIFFDSRDGFWEKAKKIASNYMPDIIFTQLNGLKRIMEINRICKSKIIYFFHSYTKTNLSGSLDFDFNLLKDEQIKKIICISKYIKNSLPNELQKKAYVIYPYINEEKYKHDILLRKNITFFNPIKTKGVEIVLGLAKRLPEIIFEIYETWQPIPQVYLDISKQYKNIIIYKHSEKNLYKNTKIFIMPSQCTEGFGRGIVESGLNGIPTIASFVGGIPEAMKKSKFMVEDYTNIEQWEEKVKRLYYNEEFYQKESQQSIERSLGFCNREKYKDELSNIVEDY